jgi:hypothetical protein
VVQAVSILSSLASLQFELELRLRMVVSAGQAIPCQYGWRVSRLRLFSWSMITVTERLSSWMDWHTSRPEKELAVLGNQPGENLAGVERATFGHLAQLPLILSLWPLCRHHQNLLFGYPERPSLAFLADETLLPRAEWALVTVAPSMVCYVEFGNLAAIISPDHPVTRELYPRCTEQFNGLAGVFGLLPLMPEDTDMSELDPDAQKRLLPIDRSLKAQEEKKQRVETEEKLRGNKARYSGKRAGPYWGSDPPVDDEWLYKEMAELVTTQMQHFREIVDSLDAHDVISATQALLKASSTEQRRPGRSRYYSSDSDSG